MDFVDTNITGASGNATKRAKLFDIARLRRAKSTPPVEATKSSTPVKFKALLFVGKHESCTQSDPMNMAMSAYGGKIEFTRISHEDLHKEGEEMDFDDLMSTFDAYDFGVAASHMHQV